MRSDITIAQSAKLKPITEIARAAGIDPSALELYGPYKAKVGWGAVRAAEERPDGRLILVSAISPTPAGEGKTTVSVGLADGMNRIGNKTMLALREPSLGPVFGVKGGAAGGGYAQVAPMEDINLHFTGDLHAITAAANLLAAMLDNHIYQGNALGIDPARVVWKRAVDMNDRQLRHIVSGLGGAKNGAPREDGYEITVASEVMAVFCLASGIRDLKERLGRMIVAYNRAGEPVTAHDLRAEGAMAALLKDALKPNLVQTLEGTPALIHGGPFANIAHGCNSLIATRFALKMSDYVITEAGFGADLGAEKFVDIKCRVSGLRPSACVVVATVRALRHHGAGAEDPLGAGMANLRRHMENVRERWGLPAVVAINRFPDDSDDDIARVTELCFADGFPAVEADVWAKGGAGAERLAAAVAALCAEPSALRFTYADEAPIRDKLDMLAQQIYGGTGVELKPAARKGIKAIEAMGLGRLPVCVAKTQYSFSDRPKLTGAPEGFTVSIRDVKLSAGAGFVVAYAGDVMTMPGLGKKPAAEQIDVNDDGTITGLF